MMEIKNNQKISTIVLILLLTTSSLFFVLSTATAQEFETRRSYVFLGATPNPVGVNQQVLLHIGVIQYLSSTELGWEDLSVTIEKPDGETETIDDIRTDSTGGTGVVYVPTMVGTYYLQGHFPTQSGSIVPDYYSPPINVTLLASDSQIVELVVQEDPLTYYQGHSLPTEYWSRPINSQLWEWSTVSGNWLWPHRIGCTIPNFYAAYNDGPETSHILWSTPMTTGGLVGGDIGPHSYDDGDAYEGLFGSPIILNGVLYYNKYKAGYPIQEVEAIDLHTGEKLWCKTLGDNERLYCGQTFYFDSFNYHAAFDYLWTLTSVQDWTTFAVISQTFNAYDPTSGQWIFTMENVPVSPGITFPEDAQVFGPNGEIFRYLVDLPNGWIALWNSTKAVNTAAAGAMEMGSWGSVVMGNTFDASLGIEWNKTLSEDLSAYADSRQVLAVLEDRVIGGTTDEETSNFLSEPIHLWAISLDPGNEGEVIFNTEWERPSEFQHIVYRGASFEEEIFVLGSRETLVQYAFSIDTGDLVWSNDEAQSYLNSYDLWGYDPRNTAIADGKVITVGLAGIVIAYSAETGNLEWTYEAADHYSEILWGNNWPLQILFITDGKIYLAHNEHSPIDPKARGAPFVCLDLDGGEEVWRIDGAFRGHYWGGAAIIGDSIIATYDTYDQQIYAIGKGPTTISVNAPDTTQALGTPILIKGTVMDTSPGTENAAVKLRFQNGVPAVSDVSMNKWMKYVYMQFERPEDTIGVTVSICAVDPNGNYQDLGKTTSDSYGNYGLAFDPEVEGTYQIIASFEGSEAYYGSTTTTYVQVNAVSAATPIDNEPIDTEPPVEAEEPAGFVISTEVAIIAAVAVAAIISVVAYVLFKRK